MMSTSYGFCHDRQALDINDQYMFKSILVCPVTEAVCSKDAKDDFNTIKSRKLYLPKGTIWYDFCFGENTRRMLSKKVPIDIIIVCGWFIMPFDRKFSMPLKRDGMVWKSGLRGPIVLTLYEDEGDNYNYERNVFNCEFKWINATRTLKIGERKGMFSGMLNNRNFQIIIVSKDHGTGTEEIEHKEREVKYTGKEMEVVF